MTNMQANNYNNDSSAIDDANNMYNNAYSINNVSTINHKINEPMLLKRGYISP